MQTYLQMNPCHFQWDPNISNKLYSSPFTPENIYKEAPLLFLLKNKPLHYIKYLWVGPCLISRVARTFSKILIKSFLSRSIYK